MGKAWQTAVIAGLGAISWSLAAGQDSPPGLGQDPAGKARPTPSEEARAPQTRILALEADLKVLDRKGTALRQEQVSLQAAKGRERERLDRKVQELSEEYRRLYSETRDRVISARAEFPGDARIRRLHLPFAVGERRLDVALADLDAITADAPADAAMGLARIRLLLALGKPENVPALVQALRGAANEPGLGAEPLIEALMALCRWNEALAELEALKGESESAEHLPGIEAQALFQSGAYERAELIARQAISEIRKRLERGSDPQRAQRLQTMMGELGALAEAAALYPGHLEQEQRLLALEQEADDLPRVLLHTSRGGILIELFEDSAPNTVANFLSLARKHFFDGTLFHRVEPGFMAQGGDPNTRAGDPSAHGRGGPGYTLADECRDPGARMHFAGRLSMANSGPDSGGSQFFITHSTTWHLNGRHTVFGRVLEGMPVVLALRKGDALERVEIVRKRDHPYRVIRTGR